MNVDFYLCLYDLYNYRTGIKVLVLEGKEEVEGNKKRAYLGGAEYLRYIVDLSEARDDVRD